MMTAALTLMKKASSLVEASPTQRVSNLSKSKEVVVPHNLQPIAPAMAVITKSTRGDARILPRDSEQMTYKCVSQSVCIMSKN